MKRNVLKFVLCSVLIAALLAAPMSALAASNVAYLLKVSVSDAPGTYVRSGSASDNNAVIASLRNGTIVLYSGKANGQMLYCLAADGTAGYIYQGNLKAYGAVNTRQIYVTTGTTGVYTRAGRQAGTVGANYPVLVYGINGNWAYCRSISGAAAYLPMSSLKAVY